MPKKVSLTFSLESNVNISRQAFRSMHLGDISSVTRFGQNFATLANFSNSLVVFSLSIFQNFEPTF